jgi:hypothetical protein
VREFLRSCSPGVGYCLIRHNYCNSVIVTVIMMVENSGCTEGRTADIAVAVLVSGANCANSLRGTTVTQKPSPDVRALAAQICSCIENGRFTELDELIAPEAHFWYNFDPTVRPWPEVRQILVATRERLRSMHFEKVRVTPTDRGWLQQHVLRMVRVDGTQTQMHAALVYRVNERGLVASLEEYFDPAVAGGN